MPRWASDVTVLRLNTGITVITVYRGMPTAVPSKQKLFVQSKLKHNNVCLIRYTVLSVNEYTPFEKHFKQYLNEHKNIFQNVDKTEFYITSV